MGLAAPRHVGSSQARAGTHVPCIGRQILNHCATREVPPHCFYSGLIKTLRRTFSVTSGDIVIKI